MTIRLRSKLRLASLGVIVIVATLEIIGLYSINALEKSADRVATSLDRIDRVQEVRVVLGQLLMPANDYLVHGDIEEAKSFSVLRHDLRERLQAARAEFNASELDAASRRLQIVDAHATSIFHIKSPIGNAGGSAMMERMDAEAAAISKDLDTLLGTTRSQAASERRRASLLKVRVNTTMIVGGVLASLLAGAWIFLFASRLASRLTSLQDAVKAVATGDLEVQMPPDVGDEIGAVGAAVNQMTHDLNDARQRLVTAERLAAIGQITVTVKHEMNNPLQGILSATELLQMAPGDSEVVKRASQAIQECALRLDDVIKRAINITEDHTSKYVGKIKMIGLPPTTPPPDE